MSPPGGTTGKGQGPSLALPPKDYYSPKACGNCHGSSNSPSGSSLNGIPYEPINPDNLKFLPSPSDCSAEIFWPDKLKTYQDFIQVNPYLKGQNYLDTLLLSRQGTFPLEVRDTSLDFYLGMKGPSKFPQFNLEIPGDAQLCAGPSKVGGIGFDACEGLEVELKDEDVGLNLEGVDLINAQNLDLEIKKVLGVSIHRATIRNGRLLVTASLDNPLINAGFPFIFGSNDVLKHTPPLVQRLLKTATPNPYDVNLYDFDVTDLILEKMPVAYRPATKEALVYSDYLAAADKSGIKTIPYFFNIARDGKLPSRLSFNQLYEAIIDYRKNVKPSEKKQDEQLNEILQKLLDTISVRAGLHPGKLLLKNLYVEFSDDPAKNLLEAHLNVKNLKDVSMLATAPLDITRLYIPGKLDITKLTGDLGISFRSQGESEFRIENLEIELGHMEYGGTQEQGPPSLIGLFNKLKDHFTIDASRPGKSAILGGKITGMPNYFSGPYLSTPAIRVTGDLNNGFNFETNLRMDGVQLRLPGLGEVTLFGNVESKLRLVPKIENETQPDGSTTQKTSWVPDPQSLHLNLSDLEIITSKGQHWSKASVQVFDDYMGPYLPSYTGPSVFVAKADLPEMVGGAYKSLQIDAAMAVPKSPDGYYDFEELAKGFAADLTMHAVRLSGNPEDWTFNVSGSHQPDATKIKLTVDSKESNSSGAIVRQPIAGLDLQFSRVLVGNRTSYLATAKANKIDFPMLQLTSPRFELESTSEPTKNGGSLYTVSTLDFSANPWKQMPKAGIVRGPIWLKLLGTRKMPLSLEIDGESPTFEIKNLNLNFGLQGLTHDLLVTKTKGRITGIDIDGNLRGFWKMDYDAFKGKGMLTLAGDSGGEGDIHLRGSDFLRLVKDDPRDPKRLVEIPIFSKTVWTVWNILGVDPVKERINGAFRLSTQVDPAFARVYNVIIDNGKILNWQMNHDHLPYTAKGYQKKTEEYIAAKALEERKAAEAKKSEEGKQP